MPEHVQTPAVDSAGNDPAPDKVINDQSWASATVAAGGRYRWVILAVGFWSMVAFSTVQGSISIIAPFLRGEFGLTLYEVGMLASAVFLGVLSVVVFAGWLVDVAGVRSMLLVGQAMTGVTLIFASVTQSFWQALIAFLLAGCGFAFSGPCTTKAISSWFAARSRATAMGVKQVGFPMAGVLTGFALPTACLAMGWRVSLALVGVAVVASGLLAFTLYRDASPYGTGHMPIGNTWRVVKDVIRHRDLVLVSMAGACYSVVQVCLTTYFVLYLRDVLSFQVVAGGMLLALCQIGGGAGRIVWGIISDNLFNGRRTGVLIIIGCVMMVLSLCFTLLSPLLTAVTLPIIALLFGLAALGWSGCYHAVIPELSGIDVAGMATGVSLAIVNVGCVSGPLLFGVMVDSTGSYSVAWAMSAVFSLVGVLLLALIREKTRLT